jgi:hypothetical protein
MMGFYRGNPSCARQNRHFHSRYGAMIGNIPGVGLLLGADKPGRHDGQH